MFRKVLTEFLCQQRLFAARLGVKRQPSYRHGQQAADFAHRDCAAKHRQQNSRVDRVPNRAVGQARNCEPHKTTDVCWFPLNDLPPNLTMTARNAIHALHASAQSLINPNHRNRKITRNLPVAVQVFIFVPSSSFAAFLAALE
jgi:hypothetical protein